MAALPISTASEYLQSLMTSAPSAANSLAWHRWVRLLLQRTAASMAGSSGASQVTQKLKELVRAGTGEHSLSRMRLRYGRLTLLTDRPLTPEEKETSDLVVRKETASTVPIRSELPAGRTQLIACSRPFSLLSVRLSADEEDEEEVEEFFDPMASSSDEDEDTSEEDEGDFDQMISSSSSSDDEGDRGEGIEDDEEEEEEVLYMPCTVSSFFLMITFAF